MQKVRYTTFLVLLFFALAILPAAKTRATTDKSYAILFNHSGSDEYSFNLKDLNGGALAGSVAIKNTAKEQPLCQAVVISNIKMSTYRETLDYHVSWSPLSNGKKSIPYSVRAERASLEIAKADENTNSMDLSVRLNHSGVGAVTYEVCSLYVTLNEDVLTEAHEGQYSGTVTFELTTQL